jgi:hypothetical protein
MKKVTAILASIGALAATASPTFAQASFQLCPQGQSGGADRSWNILCDVTPGNALPGILTLALVIAVIIALLYLIWGGIKWITSGGDKGNVETARNQIIAAIIGLIVVFLAWFIINIILQFFFGEGAGLTGGNDLQTPQIDVVPDGDGTGIN